jgi:competence protein ComEC
VRENNNYKPIKAGDFFKYGGVKIQVLWPYTVTSYDWNANSLVLRASYGSVSLLLMGDANNDVENALLNEKKDLRASILKVGHHGASDSTSEKFIKEVAPEYAVISVNGKNLNGYPAKEVIEMLRERGIKILTTYSDGNIILRTDGKDVFLIR